MNELKTKLLTTIKQIKSDKDNTVTFKLSAWPYSRAIISAVCLENEIEFEVKRVTKDHEEFKMYVIDNAVKNFRNVLKYVHKLARINSKENKVKYTESRNIIVKEFIDENFLECTSSDFYPTKVEKSKKEKVVVVKEDKNFKATTNCKKAIVESNYKVEVKKIEEPTKITRNKKVSNEINYPNHKKATVISNERPGDNYIKNGKTKQGVQIWKLKA